MPKSVTQFKSVMAPAAGIDQNLPINLIKDQAWSDGNNVHFGVGYVEKVEGWEKFVTQQLDGVVMAIDNYYKYNGDAYLMVITTKRVYSYDNANKVFIDITGTTLLTGDIKTPVFTDTGQNYFVFTNGKDPVKYWTGSGNIANLPGLTDCVPWNDGVTVSVITAKCLLYTKNFLLLLGTTETDGVSQIDYPQRFRWSSLGDITVWKNTNQALQDLQAGWADLTDGVDWGQCLATLGDYVVAYKERSIQVISYVGGDEIWDKWPAIDGIGLLAPKGLLDLGETHVFVGPANIYSFDLRSVQPVGDAIRERFYEMLDPDNTHLTNTFYYEEIPEGGFSFVSTQSTDNTPDRALIYNTLTKAWSWRDLPMMCFGYYNSVDDPTWDNQDYTWNDSQAEAGWDSSKRLANAPINICGDENGYIYSIADNSKDGADMDSFVQTKLFDFGNPVLLKRAIRLQLMISHEGDINLPVYIGTADNVDDNIVWSGPYNMSLANAIPPWIDFDITARYMIFKFGTSLMNQPWKLTGYVICYQYRGMV